MNKTTLLILGLGAATTAQAAIITIENHSFESDVNSDGTGGFANGERADFVGGQLTGWIAQSGADNEVSVGFKDIPGTELDGNQALALITGASVLNTTTTAWSSFSVGDELTLTISLGMRSVEVLDWNEGTFFGLTDGAADLSTIELGDTIANSGLIANNPATGNQAGDGTFFDVSFSHTIVAGDLTRNGNIGILIYAEGTGASHTLNQSFYDDVRLTAVPEPSSAALLLGLGSIALVLRRRK